jgi:hypothetical protein
VEGQVGAAEAKPTVKGCSRWRNGVCLHAAVSDDAKQAFACWIECAIGCCCCCCMAKATLAAAAAAAMASSSVGVVAADWADSSSAAPEAVSTGIYRWKRDNTPAARSSRA